MFQNTFNILALSGGGIKGIFQATFLNLLEERYEFPLMMCLIWWPVPLLAL